MTMRDAEERAIVEGLRAADPGAFLLAYERYRVNLYSFLRRLARRDDLAEDLFQETWLKLARHATRLRADTDLRAWLFRVAHNAWTSHCRWAALPFRRARSIDGASLDEADPKHRTPGPSEQRVDAARELAVVERAMAELPARAREVLLLVAVEGMEPAAAAAVLGIRADALRQRLARARQALADRLAVEPQWKADR